MLNKWDDYLIHQTAGSINKVESDDPHWFDRMYFGISNPDGWSHGQDRGQLHIEGEDVDTSSPSPLDSLPIRVYCQIAEISLGSEVAVGWFEGGGSQSYQYKPVW